MDPASAVDFLLGAAVGLAISMVLAVYAIGRGYQMGLKDGRRRTIEALERATVVLENKKLDAEWLEKQADTFG
jgi:hypothetical protein